MDWSIGVDLGLSIWDYYLSWDRGWGFFYLFVVVVLFSRLFAVFWVFFRSCLGFCNA